MCFILTIIQHFCHPCTSIKRRRLTWLGHVLRMNSDRIPQKILSAPQSSHSRPCQTWDRIVHGETKCLSYNVCHSIGTIHNWSVDGRQWITFLHDLAASRSQWRNIVSIFVSIFIIGSSRGISCGTILIITARCICHIKDSISLAIKRRRLIWLGHVLRMNSDRISQKISAHQSSHLQRPQGRPCQTWDRIVHKDSLS